MRRFFWLHNLVFLLVAVSSACGITFKSSLESIKVEARPGQVVNRSFQLTLSNTETRTHFKSHVDEWWRSEDGSQSFYRPAGSSDGPSRSCTKWVKLNPVETTVEPGGTLVVRVTIAVPQDAKPGGYWCALTVDEVPDPLSSPPGVGVRFIASVSTGIFVYISPVKRSAQITDVQISAERASVKLTNNGDCPLGVEGRFEFVPVGETKPAAVVTIPRGTLLPEPINSGIFSGKLCDKTSLPSGRYLVRAILDIGLDHYIGVQKEMDIDRGEAVKPVDK